MIDFAYATIVLKHQIYGGKYKMLVRRVNLDDFFTYQIGYDFIVNNIGLDQDKK